MASDNNDIELLNFYGTVRDQDSNAVAGAVVIVVACLTGGAEETLGYAITGEDGGYLICTDGPPDYNALTGFKVRAGKNGPATGMAQGNIPTQALLPEQAKLPVTEKVSAEAALTDKTAKGKAPPPATKANPGQRAGAPMRPAPLWPGPFARTLPWWAVPSKRDKLSPWR